MKKVSKAQQFVVDKINSGYSLSARTINCSNLHVTLEHPADMLIHVKKATFESLVKVKILILDIPNSVWRNEKYVLAAEYVVKF